MRLRICVFARSPGSERCHGRASRHRRSCCALPCAGTSPTSSMRISSTRRDGLPRHRAAGLWSSARGVRTSTARRSNRGSREFYNPWAVRSADFVTCDSADQARVLRSWGVSASKVAVVGWGVDRDVFHPGVDGAGLKARLRIPASAPVVLSPRRWLPNSNIDTVIAAHAKLAADVFLILKRLPRSEYGRGGAVETAMATSPARDRIRVVEEVDEAELPALYAAADVVVSLCSTDGTPVSVLEAMALGRPVVALGNESVSEWVSEPGGRIVASLDASAIARAVAAFLDGSLSRDVVANHNIAIVTARADRAAEMARAGEIYTRLHALPRT